MVVRIGAVGLGEPSRLEGELLAEMSGVELVGGAVVTPEVREAFVAEFDARVYDNHETLLAAEDIDAVNIATPHTLPIGTHWTHLTAIYTYIWRSH